MKKKFSIILLALLLVLVLATGLVACDPETPTPDGDGDNPTPAPGHTHTWSAWTDNGDGTCSRVCTLDSTHTESGNHVDADANELCDNCGLDLFANRKVDEAGWNAALSLDNSPNFRQTYYSSNTLNDGETYYIEQVIESDGTSKRFSEVSYYFNGDEKIYRYQYLYLVVNAGNYIFAQSSSETDNMLVSEISTKEKFDSFYSSFFDLPTLFPFANFTYNAENHCYIGEFEEQQVSAFFEDGKLVKLAFVTEDGNYEPTFTYGDASIAVPDDACPEGLVIVTLDYQDESIPDGKLFVEANSKISQFLPKPEGNSYRNFRGWYENPQGEGRQWLSSKVVTGDITLYAIWKYNTQEVVFDLNYKDAPKPTTEMRPMGIPLDLSNVPEREYWVFAGWYTDAELTTPYDVDAIFNSKLTLYAAWTIDPNHEHSHEKSVIDATCTTDGYDLYVCVCGDSYQDNVVPALGHDLTFETGDYMGMAICANEGCKYAERRASERIYEDVFVYTFDEAKKNEIQSNLNKIFTTLQNADRYDQALHAYDKTSEFYTQNKEFEALFDKFYGDISYLTEQYQYAYVFYCVKQSSENVDAFLAVDEYRTQVITDFYSIYGLVYDTCLREYFYDKVEGGWTDEDIEEALEMSKSYGDPVYANINKRLSEIEVESQSLSASSPQIPVLYEEFVGLKTQLAQLAGYDNYLEYAYASEYGRDYTPDEAVEMRSYVKEHLVDVFKAVQNGSLAAKSPEVGSEAAAYLAAFKSYSVFDSAIASNVIKDYFKVMNSTSYEKEIDFYHHANELFKNGNYFQGSYQGAYSYWIPAQQATILYFGPTSYSASFTFVHEFGHYYNNIYNPNASISLDLDEVHSQGNEMMFLSYLEDVLPKEVLRGMYAKLYYGQLEDMLNVIMIASAVDEFEYCVYNGVNPAGVATTYTKDNYDSLFISILSTYGIGTNSSNYWRQVAIRSAGYYISYAMSALPCVELLSVAETEGFNAAKDVYFKFFTFTDDENNFVLDSDGDKVATLTFAETLEYVGLHSVFDEGMYTYISNYFLNNTKDFTYAD